MNTIRDRFVLGCMMAGLLSAPIYATARPSAQVDFHIEAQALETALNAWARQSGYSVLVPFERAARDKSAPSVEGSYTPDHALRMLLLGADLEYEFVSARTVAIRAKNADAMPVAVSYTNQSTPPFGRADSPNSSAHQDSPVNGNNTGSVDRNTAGLQEILVTAQRREEALDKVPISITAMQQRTLDELHIESISDLATVVPGLVRRSGGAAQSQDSDIVIRGIANNSSSPTTGIYIDETPIHLRVLSAASPSGSPQPQLFDLERVEVLRGPQGTLFGSSAEGGAIRFVTPQPSLIQYSGYNKAELSFTDRGDPNYQVGVAYGGPMVDGSAGFRVSGWFSRLGGYIDREDPITGSIVAHDSNYGSAYVLRPALKFALSEQLTITAAAFVQHDSQHEPPAYWLTSLPAADQGHPASGFAPSPSDNNLSVPSLSVRYDFNAFTLQSDTSYLDNRHKHTADFKYLLQEIFNRGNAFIPGNPPFSAAAPTDWQNRAWQQELRLTSKDNNSRWQWIVGLFFRSSSETAEQSVEGDLTPITEALFGLTSLQTFGVPNIDSPSGPLSSYAKSNEKDQQKAIFGEITYELVSGLKLRAGARVERSTVDDREFVSGPLNGVINSTVVLPEQSATPVTPRFGIEYQINDRNMVYATAAKGFREGGANLPVASTLCGPDLAKLGLKAAPATFASDSVWSYEIGSKNTLFDRRLQVEGSLFYIDWTKIQQAISLPDCGGEYVGNIGAAVSKGFDLQLAAQVVEGLKVGSYVGYTDAYYSQTQLAASKRPLEVSGNKLSWVLPWTYAVVGEYSHEIPNVGAGAQAYLRADYRWLDGKSALYPNLATYNAVLNRHRDPAYDLLNVRAGMTRGGWDFSVFMTNVTDSNPELGFTPFGRLYSAIRIQPRTTGVTAYYRF